MSKNKGKPAHPPKGAKSKNNNNNNNNNKAICMDDFHKYPRTKHVLDAGGTGVSRDDLLMEGGENDRFLQVPIIVEEKIDGSNLGICKDKDFNILFQNRSKLITSASHFQWRGLDLWLKQHPGIWEVLNSEDIILFGEWCQYRHSIPYDNLPDYFIAFDLFIKSEQKFVSRAELERRLANSGIPIINKISEGKIHTKMNC